MTVALTRQPVRLAVDPVTWLNLKDVRTNLVPTIARGVDLHIQVGLFYNAAIVESVSNIDSLICEILDDLSGPALVTKTLAAGALETPPSLANWTAGTHQHAVFSFSNAETQFDMTGSAQNEKTFYLVIHAVTTNADALYIPLCRTSLKVVEDGAQNGLGTITSAAPAYRLNDGNLQLWNPDQSKWHTIYVRGAAGAEHLAIAQPED